MTASAKTWYKGSECKSKFILQTEPFIYKFFGQLVFLRGTNYALFFILTIYWFIYSVGYGFCCHSFQTVIHGPGWPKTLYITEAGWLWPIANSCLYLPKYYSYYRCAPPHPTHLTLPWLVPIKYLWSWKFLFKYPPPHTVGSPIVL